MRSISLISTAPVTPEKRTANTKLKEDGMCVESSDGDISDCTPTPYLWAQKKEAAIAMNLHGAKCRLQPVEGSENGQHCRDDNENGGNCREDNGNGGNCRDDNENGGNCRDDNGNGGNCRDDNENGGNCRDDNGNGGNCRDDNGNGGNCRDDNEDSSDVEVNENIFNWRKSIGRRFSIRPATTQIAAVTKKDKQKDDDNVFETGDVEAYDLTSTGRSVVEVPVIFRPRKRKYDGSLPTPTAAATNATETSTVATKKSLFSSFFSYNAKRSKIHNEPEEVRDSLTSTDMHNAVPGVGENETADSSADRYHTSPVIRNNANSAVNKDHQCQKCGCHQKPRTYSPPAPPYTTLVDLACADFGGRVIFSTDESYSASQNILKGSAPAPPINVDDGYSERDGWETRRRRNAGHDWCIIKLATPCIIRGFDIETTYFAGSSAPFISVEGANINDLAEHIERLKKNIDTTKPLSNHNDTGQHFAEYEMNKAKQLTGTDRQHHSIAANKVPRKGRAAKTRIRSSGFVDNNQPVVAKTANGADGGATKQRLPGNGLSVLSSEENGTSEQSTAVVTCNVVDDNEMQKMLLIRQIDEVLEKHSAVDKKQWIDLLPMVELMVDCKLNRQCHNYFAVDNSRAGNQMPSYITFLRLNLFPDGGVARFRVYGEVKLPPFSLCASPVLPHSPRNLCDVLRGAFVLCCSDEEFGSSQNLLLPAVMQSQSKYRGWLTARKILRSPVLFEDEKGKIKNLLGDDFAVIKLSERSRIGQFVNVDVSPYHGSSPSELLIEACDMPEIISLPINQQSKFFKDHSKRIAWKQLVPRSHVVTGKVNIFEVAEELLNMNTNTREAYFATHIKFVIFPDGGVSRLQVLSSHEDYADEVLWC